MPNPSNKALAKGGAAAIEKVGGKLARKAAGATLEKAAAAINPLAALEAIVTTYGDYRKVVAQEKTKRAQIDAWRELNLEKIRAQREILLTYLDRTFDERKANFKKLFEVMDSALDAGQTELLTKTLDSVTQLAKTSPFRDIATVEQVRAILDAPGQDVDL